jgi:hypothetical protein
VGNGLRVPESGVLRHVSVRACTGIDPDRRRPNIRWIIRDLTENRRLQAQVTRLDERLWSHAGERTNRLNAELDRCGARLPSADPPG